ncbi:nitroreductase family protein [Lacticaseibacillus porcinae]|uniref:nitroreductase family protein n=1 Tax=Lacticaseibacillus porcinae TaxID=1123687 RepID=UPI0013DDB5A9|nr:nitroreductase family protein [Lacticaseibacillus porcinae]
MELSEVLLLRHAQRAYTGEKVTDAQLEAILQAGELAPVALGQFEKYHLTVIDNPAILDAIESATATLFHRHGGKMLYGAPTFVLVSAQGEQNADFSSAAIIAHNLALKAVDEGVGFCYIWGAVAAINQTPSVIAKLQLPEGFKPVCGVTLGQIATPYVEKDTDPNRIGITRL